MYKGSYVPIGDRLDVKYDSAHTEAFSTDMW